MGESLCTHGALRVAIVAPSLDILGGQAIQAKRLVDRLRDVPGVDVRFIPVNPRLPGALGRLQDIKYIRTVVTEACYLFDLLVGLRDRQVAHIFSASYFSFVLAPTPALLLSKLYRIPSVLNYRSGEAADHLRRWRLAAPTLRLARRIVVGTEYLVGVFRSHELVAETIPNIVDVERYRYRERRPLRPLFLANRNLEPHYAVGTVIRAFALIRERHPDARLLIAGQGRERSSLEDLAAELAPGGVQFVGPVEPEAMRALYDRSDIYLNGSEIDNMPTSLLEAFAAGLPVVSTGAGGIPFIVRHGETGSLALPGDFRKLADLALELLDEPERALEMARAARAECVLLYTGEAVRDAWVALYRRLAEDASGDRASVGAEDPDSAALEDTDG